MFILSSVAWYIERNRCESFLLMALLSSIEFNKSSSDSSNSKEVYPYLENNYTLDIISNKLFTILNIKLVSLMRVFRISVKSWI